LGEIKRLRWSYVAREYDQATNTYVYTYIQRVGKIDGRVLETLIETGDATLEVLAEIMGQRVQDLRRRSLARLQSAGLVVVDGERVSLASDWREKLGIARTLGDEYATEGRKRDQHRRGREAYREHRAGKNKADRAPTEAEMDADPRRETRKKQRRVGVPTSQPARFSLPTVPSPT
jgi:hypothetical protein